MQGWRTWIRLNDEGGKVHEMPCHHNLDKYLHAYIDQVQRVDGKGWSFCSAIGRTGPLSKNPVRSAGVYRMIARRELNFEGQDPDRLSLVQGHGDHRVPEERGQARDRAAENRP